MAMVSDIPHELIVSIAQSLDLFEDFVDFGYVCKSWRSAATKENFSGAGNLTHQVPLLMLPRATIVHPLWPMKKKTYKFNPDPKTMMKKKKKIDLKSLATEIRDVVEFYSLARGKILRFNLPEIKGKLCFSSLGWLLTQSEEDFFWSKSEKDLKFNLFHPISHSTIELPDGLPSPGLRKIQKLVLSSTPTCSNSNYTVMLQTLNGVLFCRPGLGEKSWTSLETLEPMLELYCFRGQFYVVQLDCHARAASLSVLSDDFQQLREVAPRIPTEIFAPYSIKTYNLAECAGVLLLVLFTCHPEGQQQTVGCRVFELPRNGNSWLDSEVRSLGNKTLFLSSSNSSFSIEASVYPGCKPNCIYFINQSVVYPMLDMDIGCFYMVDGTIDRHPFKSIMTGFEQVKKSPLWIQPTSS